MDKFSARETEWMLELDGIPLAGFWRRAFAFAIDGLLALILLSVVVSAVVTGYMKVTGENPYIATPAKVPRSEADLEKLKPTVEKNSQEFAESRTGRALKLTQEIVIPILYFGVLLWWGNGRWDMEPPRSKAGLASSSTLFTRIDAACKTGSPKRLS